MAARSKLAVILHADIVGSTALVRKDEGLAHDRIQAAFQLFSQALRRYGGTVHEIRGDALVAEFSRASDAVIAALAALKRNVESNAEITDEVVPQIRVGIALGEVVIADQTLTGAGVILAQRLEQLAEPGGICISAAVREAVPDRLALGYSDLGAHEAKGFDERVVAYSVALKLGEVLPEPTLPVVERGLGRAKWQWFSASVAVVMIVGSGLLSWLQPWEPEFEPARPDKMALALPEKPSIAVLPFDNLTGDASQDFISDGMSENIIAVLATSPDLLVIARNSTFTYKGKPAEVREVAERLGVRYVMEGSIQGSAERLRVTAQLIDAVDGKHVWAERYDRALPNFNGLLDIQDDIAERIRVELDVKLTMGPVVRAQWEELGDFDTYRKFVKWRASFQTFSKDGNREADKLAEVIFKRRPETAIANRLLGWQQWQKVTLGISPNKKKSMAAAQAFVKKALAINDNDPTSQVLKAYLELFSRAHISALRHAERAIELTPAAHQATALAGFVKIASGEPGEGVRLLKLAIRSEPDYPQWTPGRSPRDFE